MSLVELPRPVKLSHGPAGWHIQVLNESGDFPTAEKDDCATVLEAWAFANKYLRWLSKIEREVAA